jgi:bifunctional enzyme CysN/CysC/sulfate adenylyltransferase subunit 1
MNPRPLTPGKQYLLKHTTQTVKAAVTAIENRINISTFDKEEGITELSMNDLGEVRIKTAKPLIFDGYASNRLTGSFILIEPGTNATVAAGMLLPPTEVARPEYKDFAI